MDYAHAEFKYNGKEVLDKLREQDTSESEETTIVRRWEART